MERTPVASRYPYQWRRAWKAIRLLIRDPKQTDQVFEILEALTGGSFERQFQRFAADPAGRQLLLEKPALLAMLSDRDALRALPEGSLGRAYLAFMESGNLTADGLVEADAVAAERNPNPEAHQRDADREFYGDRRRDIHDLWHVLTGYGMDEAGEAANLAFTFGQIPSLGLGLIVMAGAIIGPKTPRFGWERYLIRAWRRGCRASDLTTAPYEELLALPLEDVRLRLGVEPPSIAHPEGIVVGNRDDEPTDVAFPTGPPTASRTAAA